MSARADPERKGEPADDAQRGRHAPAGGHRRGRLRRDPRRPAAGPAGRPPGRGDADQSHRLLPVPAAAARGDGGGPGSAPGSRVAADRPAPAPGCCSAPWTGSTWRAAGSSSPTPRAAAGRPVTTACCSRRAASTSCCPFPGVARHAHGFRSIAEALYLRDHLLRQLELAEACEDRAERQARCTFVVVGAGYTGTEVAAQRAAAHPESRARPAPACATSSIRWLLIDRARARATRAVASAGRDRAPDADPAGRGNPHPHHHRGGDPRRRAAVQRRVRADPVADLVRRGPSRPAGRAPRAAHGRAAG